MRRDFKIALAIVIIVMIAIAGVVIILPEKGRHDYSLAAGDYLKYTYSEDIPSNETLSYNITYQILAINGTRLDYQITSQGNVSTIFDRSKDDTPFSLVLNPPSNRWEGINEISKVPVDTKWGTIVSDYYWILKTGSQDEYYWIYHGIEVKWTMTGRGLPAHSLTLVETNMPELTRNAPS